ncbi:hypothetical protein [uncultured Clostridium sp.]|uniref:hypothetical protein n=1 Tax=uncultured Clostridium sp. TaxID=59620 RepID=UPI0028E5AF27|nr:hypothetical protein [uncultured Clostridium sp.]
MNNKVCYTCGCGIEVKNVYSLDLCYRCRKIIKESRKEIYKLEKLRLIERIH